MNAYQPHRSPSHPRRSQRRACRAAGSRRPEQESDSGAAVAAGVAPTGRNVRKTPRMSISELAASIQRVGLLQNLIVTATADGERYEVVAGGRRLAALKLLAKKHRISKEWEVPCLLVADGTARTASLTENVQREAMHPPTSSRHLPRWWPKAAPSRTLPPISASRRWWCSVA